ncbi:MAG: hypothetical protein ACRDQ1_07420, partial [Sciscionella sp.]
EVTGRELNTQHVEAKAGEMPAVIVDISMAARELGYTPSMSLREGLATVWRDFRSQLAVP